MAKAQELKLCEICAAATDSPIHMVFSQQKLVRWLICEGCTLILINTIRKMARKSEAAEAEGIPCKFTLEHTECDGKCTCNCNTCYSARYKSERET